MRFLIRVLIKHHVFIVFISLSTISLSLILKINPYNKFKILNISRNLMYYGFSIEESITEYFKLKKDNEKLKNLNLQLLKKNEFLIEEKNNLILYLKQQNLKFKSAEKRYNYIPAKVEKRNWALPNNIIILNKGKLHGIEKNMGVLNHHGVVGIVSNVTNNFCEVTTLIHQQTNLLTSIKTNNTTLNEGILKWNNNSYRYGIIEGVGNDMKINIGDSIFTSTNSNSFYGGIYIGSISNLEKKTSSNSFKIDVLFGVDFKNINNAFIITDNLKTELKSLYETQ